MVFRVAAEVAVEGPRMPDGPLAVVDSSGARGSDGTDGLRGADGGHGGGAGSRGSDAGGASVGADAGVIRVELASAGDFTASLTGEYTRGGARVAVDQRVRFERAGQLELRANGGVGGNGGRGGDGGTGGTGRSGSDATRYSSGSDGGRGGDGGNGGNGSNGARGGSGGAIVLRTNERDTHLLVLVHRECFGGAGGRAGVNGAGGAGGAGGRGGSSYSWTETERYTDSQGQSQTRTTYHSNRGGSDGASGSAGYSGRAALRPGAAGPAGSFAIEVVDARGGTQRYPDRYDVAVLGFQHDNENRDGVYEPEEKVIVSRIAVKNVGPMPTPAFHDIVIGVVEAGWVDADESKLLRLPRSLAPGETHLFERETLEFSLQGHEPKAPGEPLGERETIRLFAAIPAANRRFGAFESTLDPKTGAITVRFPVEVSEIESLYSLAQGQATRVRFRLSNVALSALGRASPGGRELGVRFRLAGGELYDGEVRVFDAQGARARLDVGFREVITVIDPQGHRDFELVIAVAPDARPYTSARFELAAELAWLDDPKTARPVHLRDLTVRVGQPFSRAPADVLLLVNNRTDRHELAAWQQVFAELGLTHTLWDASLEGSVEVLAKGAPFSLAVVLDYEMDTASGATSASELVASQRVHELAKTTGVLYVGDHRVLSRQSLAAGEGKRESVTQWFSWPWSEPEQRALSAAASARSRELSASRPDERHLVLERFEPAVEKKVLWFRKVKLGELEVCETFAAGAPSVLAIEASSISAHSADFVVAPPSVASVLSGLSFDKKLSLLKVCPLPFGARSVAVDGGVADVVVASIVDDLLYELESAAHARWKSGSSSAELLQRMPLLRALEASQREGVVALESDEGQRLVELCVWLELLASECSRWWEWLPGFWGLRRGPALRGHLRRVRRAIASRRTESDEGQRALDDAIKKRRAEIEATWEKLARSGDDAPLAWVRSRLDARFGERKPRDGRRLLPLKKRVMEGSAYDRLADDERARGELASEAFAQGRAAKGALLVDADFDSLAARADALRQDEVRELAEGATEAVGTRVLLGTE